MISLAARLICCSTRSSRQRRISPTAAKIRSSSPSRSARRPSRTCRRPMGRGGLTKLETVAWTALFAPKKTPAAIVAKVNDAVQNAMQDPTIAKRLGEIGADIPSPEQRSPEALRMLVNNEVDKWVPLIKAAGIVGQ